MVFILHCQEVQNNSNFTEIVVHHVHAYTVTILYNCSLWIRWQKIFIR